MKIKLFLMILLFVLVSTEAFAHKVIVFAWVEDGMIYTQSSFASKRKAQKCPLTVLDDTGLIVHKGVTNEQGEYSFEIPEKVTSDLTIQLDAGTGHKGQWKISRDELVLPATQQRVDAAARKKEQLEQGPSLVKIIAGLAVIFILAAALKLFKRKKGAHD